ncbi:MAG: hypothetical protein Q7K48_03530 [Fusobacterium sp. JB021]|nr:hypothetical protein [Fusobacterium sp. JB021]
MLNLKDNNIFFKNNFVKNINIKGVTSKVFLAELTYSPAHCECCGLIITLLLNMGLKIL